MENRVRRERILLIRHGHSSHTHDGRWLHATNVAAFEDAYDAAGIRDDSTPPPPLSAAAAVAGMLCASNLTRAIDSARRLVPEHEVLVSPLLREIRLEPPRWIPFRLPIQAWDALNYMQWSYRLLMKSDHEFIQRAESAATWLEEQTRQCATVAVVTHGAFRRLIAASLAARGWRAGASRRSYENWSVWELLREEQSHD
jgi:broad specificity phosphatase PhoE